MKKLVTIMLVTLLLLTTILTASAAEYQLPQLPTNQYKYYIVLELGTEGSYAVGFFNDLPEDSDNQVVYYIIESYANVGNEWIYLAGNDETVIKNEDRNEVIYDSSMTIDNGNTIRFIIPTVGFNDFSQVYGSLAEQINVSVVVAIIVFIIGICVGLVFLWWGIRKVVRAIMAAFKKGKISL